MSRPMCRQTLSPSRSRTTRPRSNRFNRRATSWVRHFSLLFLFSFLTRLLLNFTFFSLLDHFLSPRSQESLPLVWSHTRHCLLLLSNSACLLNRILYYYIVTSLTASIFALFIASFLTLLATSSWLLIDAI
jgi:hypothetical protein